MTIIITIAILSISLSIIITLFYKNQIIEFLRTKKSIFKILRNIREFVLNNITKIDSKIYSAQDTEPRLDENSMLFSQLCTESQLESELFKKIVFEIKDTPRKHRKLWEFVYINLSLM